MHNRDGDGHKHCMVCDRQTMLREFVDQGTLSTVVVKLESEIKLLKNNNAELAQQVGIIERSCAAAKQEALDAQLETEVWPPRGPLCERTCAHMRDCVWMCAASGWTRLCGVSWGSWLSTVF